MLSEKEFYFVRHGQTDWNLAHRAQGQTDVPLNATGRREAQHAAESATQLRFETICTSPLSRAVETAEAIAGVTGGKISIQNDLIECGWGDREGEVKGVWFEKWKRGIEVPNDAETFEAFLSRATGAINRALNMPAPVLIVAHGGIYWAVQLHALRNMKRDLENATIVRHIPPTKQHPWWSAHSVNPEQT